MRTEVLYVFGIIIGVLFIWGIVWAKRSRCRSYYKTVCLEEENNKEISKQIQELKRAIKKNQLVLYYQPKVDMTTQKVAGMEALLRWKHPKKGLLSPNEFIPVAEQCSLILEIGEWVLREACMQSKRWQDKGYGAYSVAVNFSAMEFYQERTLEIIKEVLEFTKLSPNCLEIELTESMALIDIEKAISKMAQIQELGVKIALDDFGTGYSSLSYLKALPIDILKLDRSFIIDIEKDTTSREITSSMIKLAKLLNIQTVAEGVETKEQAELLTKMGCDMIQGYYYSKPIPADVFEKQYMKSI